MPLIAPLRPSAIGELMLHPGSPDLGVEGVAVAAALDADGSLTLEYVLTGQLQSLRIPGIGPVEPGDRLWEHTCFEAFVRADRHPGYFEFNFSPSRRWAAYAFKGYREADAAWTGSAPSIEVGRAAARLELSIRLPEAARTLMQQSRQLRLGLSAVVESAAGEVAYWALRHPPGRADFHHDEAFALVVEVPASGAPR